MLYTLFVLFTGVYLGQEFAIIPSVRIIIANLMMYLRGLPDPNNGGENVRNVVENAGWLHSIRRYFFW
jgi:hypothetical protein